MNRDAPVRESHRSKFRTTLVRVLVVQVIALALLGMVQAVYNVSPR